MCKYSIVVPVYNVEKYLNYCIDSILKQSYTDFELILVNDGSKDNSLSICYDYMKKDCRVIVVDKMNGGVVSARNAGLLKATGSFVLFVDSDDWIDHDLLSICDEYISIYNVDILCFNVMQQLNNGKIIPEKFNYKEGYYSKPDIESKIFPDLIQNSEGKYFNPNLFGKIIKRSLALDYMLYDEKIIMGEDGAYVIGLIYHSKSIFIIKNGLYYYRYNECSVTKGKKVFPIDGPIRINNHLIKVIDPSLFDFTMQLNRKIVHELNSVVASILRNKKYRDAKKILNEAIFCNERYIEALNKSKFSSIKAIIMHLLLKHKMFFLLKIYTKF